VIDLILKSAQSRPGGSRADDDYDVLHDGKPVGRIMKVDQAHETAWLWSIFFEDRKPNAPDIEYEPTRVTAFARSWRECRLRRRPRGAHFC